MEKMDQIHSAFEDYNIQIHLLENILTFLLFNKYIFDTNYAFVYLL